MYDPQTGKYAPLGIHGTAALCTVVKDLKSRMEAAGHTITFSEQHGNASN